VNRHSVVLNDSRGEKAILVPARSLGSGTGLIVPISFCWISDCGNEGFKVAKKVREELELGADKQRSQQAGFNHLVGKPADFSEVQQILAPVATL